MPNGINLDRTNRAKITTTTGTPGSSDKGNLIVDKEGFIWTRNVPGGSWSLDSPLRNVSSMIYPVCTGTQHDLMDSTRALKALTWSSTHAYFGGGAVCYPASGAALKTVLENSYTGTIILGPQRYEMASGKITISYPKTIVGMSRSESVIVLADEDTKDYIAVTSSNVEFKNLSIVRASDVHASSPSCLMLFSASPQSGVYGCNIGDADTVMDSGSSALIQADSASTLFTVRDCWFTLDCNAGGSPPALIKADDCNSIVISGNSGADLNCRWSILLDDCPAATIENNLFTNYKDRSTTVGISLTGSSASSNIVNNRIANIDSYGSMTLSKLLFVDDTTMGVTGFVSNVHVVNNQFSFTADTGMEDKLPKEALITLGIKDGTFIGNKVVAEYHGYEDDVATDIVPEKIVVLAYGDRITISNNNFKTPNCRCALMLDSIGSEELFGYGHRITNNDFYGYSIDTTGTVVATGLRNDATGIYLADNGGLGIAPQGGVISGNTFWSNENSTAIRGCPANCAAPSWPPLSGDTAYHWSITGNIMKTDSRFYAYGISVATISFSTIIGNLAKGDRVCIDTSELGGYSNDTNEYGTSGTTEPGTNPNPA